jgi:FkbM family methyltransferase
MITRLDGHQDQAGAWDVISAATGRVAWDVGSNVGQAAKVLAKNFDRVMAFEPCAESYAILYDEAPGNVEALPFAIGRVDGTITLDVAEHSINTGQLVSPGRPLPGWGGYQGSRTVPCRSLDSFLMHNDKPDFVKIDVEGSEIEVLEGARLLFAEVRPRVIVEVHREEHGPLVRELLPGYELIELRHGPYARPGGPTWLNHYWLHGRHRGRAV